MDSFTLFSHIVDTVGTHICSRAHIELQGLGVLPKANLEKPTPLTQRDADVRAAFAIWCGLAIPTNLDGAGKRFFDMIKSGRGQVPIAADGENFVLKLAEILRSGEESKVHKIFVSHVITSHDGFHGSAHIIYKDGSGSTYRTGDEFTPHSVGSSLDDLQLVRIGRDLRTVQTSWPDEPQPQTASLRFVGGLIQIEKYGERNEVPRGETSAAC